jgi:hypothetical protein
MSELHHLFQVIKKSKEFMASSSSNENERKQQQLLIDTSWTTVRDRINNSPEEAYCNKKLGASIRDIRWEMPFDICCQMTTLINDANSIYDVFEHDEIESHMEQCFEYEPPSSTQARDLFHSAVLSGKNNLAEKVGFKFPDVYKSSAICDDFHLAKEVVASFPQVLDNNDLVRDLFLSYLAHRDEGTEGTDMYILLQRVMKRSVGRRDDQSLTRQHENQICIARQIASFRRGYTDEVLMHQSFSRAFFRIIMVDYPCLCEHRDIVGLSGMLKYAVRKEHVTFIRFVISKCPAFFPYSPNSAGGTHDEEDRHVHIAIRHFGHIFDEEDDDLELRRDLSRYRNYFVSSLRCAINEKLPKSLTTLLGIGISVEENAIYPPNKLDWDFRCRVLSNGSMNVKEVGEKIVACIEICENLYPHVRQNLVSEWITCKKDNFTVEIMADVVKALNINLTQRDSNGLIPLERAAIEFSKLQMNTIYSETNTARNVFSLLLNADYSDKCPASFQCSDGRYPLHIASYNGLNWSHGLDLLLDANPSLLSRSDNLLGLKPFALAAAENDAGGDEIDLNSIFELLRHEPTALQTR